MSHAAGRLNREARTYFIDALVAQGAVRQWHSFMQFAVLLCLKMLANILRWQTGWNQDTQGVQHGSAKARAVP